MIKVILIYVAVLVGIFIALCLALLLLPSYHNTSKLRLQASDGDVHAQFELGHLSYTGQAAPIDDGMIPQDNQQAVHWLGLAASAGYAKAFLPYASALGRSNQSAKSREWYTKATDDKCQYCSLIDEPMFAYSGAHDRWPTDLGEVQKYMSTELRSNRNDTSPEIRKAYSFLMSEYRTDRPRMRILKSDRWTLLARISFGSAGSDSYLVSAGMPP